MRYLGGEEILAIHHEIIESTGGRHGVRDLGLLKSVLAKPRTSFGGNEMYSDIFLKAAAYYESLARYHIFIDGNKRTSFISASRFLHKNGYRVTPSQKEVVEFTLKITINKEMDILTVSQWLKKHSKKLK